ncbi:50S ribosomal protein L25 [Luteolibacter yonseiensis]|uniref:Large ribosomal subunit protein bL25 n=1 Tax=Luteolibacter yonseiensis TaxID=1144680 RepID=A0A934R337_9BACT|nr:50S ribosomal protein L25 [Luteolibacter yonseiensis]MBK1816146.1 50S ribosomal protein L25 [Luteolibacter yonseiensis]
MAKKASLKAAPRARSGSGRLKQMRREGWLPSVIYGRGVEAHNLKVDAKTFSELLAHSSSENILINLDIEGEGTRLAFLQSVQHDPLSGSVLHVDFRAIDEKTEITAHIPTHLNGESVGVKAGGLVEQYVHAIEILCLPNDLPETIEVDISALEIGASLHIGDIKFPAGVRATHAADVVVAHIGKPAAAVSEAAAAPTK